jgi:signal transduction histidine kinase
MTGWLSTDLGRPPLDDGTDGAGDATRAVSRVLGFCTIALRGGVGLLGAVSAIVGIGGPVSAAWVVPFALGQLVWAGLFVVEVARRGLRTWVLVIDLAVTVTLCLCQLRLVPPVALPAGTSWVAVIASMTVVYAHLAWRPHVAVPVGLVITAAYVAGQHDGLAQAGVLTLQNVSTMTLMILVRRASAVADRELVSHHRTLREVRIRAAQLTAEREADRRLHDTVLATLTTVGSGGIARSDTMLRARARSDLETVAVLGVRLEPETGLVRVDLLLHQVADHLQEELLVETWLDECVLEDRAADAIVASTTQALANVIRYAQVDRAVVTLVSNPDEIVVSVRDDGVGFVTTDVPSHHMGIRESMHGRMSDVGGRVRVESGPGSGTTVTMWCPRHG